MTCTRGASERGRRRGRCPDRPAEKPAPDGRARFEPRRTRRLTRTPREANRSVACGSRSAHSRPHVDWLESARQRRGAPRAKATCSREDYEDTQSSPYVGPPRDAGSRRACSALVLLAAALIWPGVGKRRLRGYEGPGRDQALRRERPDRGRRRRRPSPARTSSAAARAPRQEGPVPAPGPRPTCRSSPPPGSRSRPRSHAAGAGLVMVRVVNKAGAMSAKAKAGRYTYWLPTAHRP